VKGLPKNWKHDDLNKAFEKFGKVHSAKVSIDSDFNSRGYGFVQFDSEQAIQKAIAEMNDLVIPADQGVANQEETKLSVCEFVPKLDRVGTSKPRCSNNLYVKNFPHTDYTED
jgi:polyadenylate-binding protein